MVNPVFSFEDADVWRLKLGRATPLRSGIGTLVSGFGHIQIPILALSIFSSLLFALGVWPNYAGSTLSQLAYVSGFMRGSHMPTCSSSFNESYGISNWADRFLILCG